MSSVLYITLFGGMRVAHDNGSNFVKLTPVLQGLLAYLLLNRQRYHPRDVLAGLFWGDQNQDRARGALNTALWRLRRALDLDGTPGASYFCINPTGEVGFNNESPHWLDAAEFDDQVDKILSRPAGEAGEDEAQNLENVLKLYQGELLEGCYEDWALRERERFRSLYLDCLEYLLAFYRQSRMYEKSLAFGQKILALDPLREEIHREMMQLYLESGQRAYAIRQYHLCRECLAAELEIAPMEETETLYQSILVEARIENPGPPAEMPISLKQALRQLQLARQQVQQAMRYIENFTEGPK